MELQPFHPPAYATERSRVDEPIFMLASGATILFLAAKLLQNAQTFFKDDDYATDNHDNHHMVIKFGDRAQSPYEANF